ncbi:MAG: hypothetical protein RL685_2333 [Pseudomonadota bacterium]
MLGSSSVKGALGRVIASDLQRRGFEVTRRGITSAGLARPDFFDLHTIVDGTRIDEHTVAVFVYVGVNDGQAIWLRPSERGADGAGWLGWRHPRWADVYERRARSLFASICARGAERVIVILPVEVEGASLERKLVRIRRLQRQAARATCASAVSTLGEGGQLTHDGQRLRRRDGFHMNFLGAQLVWKRVLRRSSLLLMPPGSSYAAGSGAAQ